MSILAASTFDAGDFAIGGAKVMLTLSNGTSLVTYSQRDGSYSFSDLLAGTYSITMVTPVTHAGPGQRRVANDRRQRRDDRQHWHTRHGVAKRL